jgi:hypothetical protein
MQKWDFIRRLETDENAKADVYWLAWECLRTSGEVVKSYGAEFLETLAKVEVLDDDPLE